MEKSIVVFKIEVCCRQKERRKGRKKKERKKETKSGRHKGEKNSYTWEQRVNRQS